MRYNHVTSAKNVKNRVIATQLKFMSKPSFLIPSEAVIILYIISEVVDSLHLALFNITQSDINMFFSHRNIPNCKRSYPRYIYDYELISQYWLKYRIWNCNKKVDDSLLNVNILPRPQGRWCWLYINHHYIAITKLILFF